MEVKTMSEQVIGYAIVYENIAVYAPIGQVRDAYNFITNNKRKKFGEFLGIIKGLIPDDPFRISYEYLKHDKAFRNRRSERKILRNFGLTRAKMSKAKRYGQSEIKKFF